MEGARMVQEGGRISPPLRLYSDDIGNSFAEPVVTGKRKHIIVTAVKVYTTKVKTAVRH